MQTIIHYSLLIKDFLDSKDEYVLPKLFSPNRENVTTVPEISPFAQYFLQFSNSQIDSDIPLNQYKPPYAIP